MANGDTSAGSLGQLNSLITVLTQMVRAMNATQQAVSNIVSIAGVTGVNGATGAVTLTVANTGTTLRWDAVTPTQLDIPTTTTSVTGLLSNTDWNTFNGKQGTITLTTTGSSGAATLIGNTLNIPTYGAGSGTVTNIATTGPLTGGPITTTGTIGITQAATSTDGYLSSIDWNTFNGKQASGSYITALTGEGTASGPGSATLTLTNSAVIGKVLTGYVSGAGTITATDSILSAIQKLNGNIVANTYTFSTGLTNTAGTITATLSTGISGGQTATGGTGSAENLILQSTTNATLGYVGVTTAVRGVATYPTFALGSGGFAGSAGNFSGVAAGTILGVNAPSGFTGKYFDAQLNGVTQISMLASASFAGINFYGRTILQSDSGGNQLMLSSNGASGMGVQISAGNLGTNFLAFSSSSIVFHVGTDGTGAAGNSLSVGVNCTQKLSALTAQPQADFTASGTGTASGTTVTGTSTKYLTEAGIGDRISLANAPSTFGYVTAIATGLSLTSSVSFTATGQTMLVKKSIWGVNNSAGARQWTIDDQGTLWSGSAFPSSVLNNNLVQITAAGAASFQTIQAVGFRLVNLVNGPGNSQISGGNTSATSSSSINLQNIASDQYAMVTMLNTTGNPNMFWNARPNSTELLYQWQKSGTAIATFANSGNLFLGGTSTSPTAYLHLAAGTATASTSPLKFTSGTNLSTTEAGAIEYNGTHLYFTAANSGPRFQLDQQVLADGSFSQTVTAVTTFTVTTGVTVAGASFKANVTPTALLSAAVFYVTNKTTTTFDVVFISALTGTVTFDWAIFP